MTPLQNLLLKSLLGSLVGVAWAWRDWLTAWADERPVLRLDTRRVKRPPPAVVAGLVGQPGKGGQKRRAPRTRADPPVWSTGGAVPPNVARGSPPALLAGP